MKQLRSSMQTKLYNVVFPVWMLILFPPAMIISLIGNLIIDSVVLIGCCFLLKLNKEWNWQMFYKKHILKVWLFGLLADVIGAAILLSCVQFQDFLGISREVINGITLDPFSNILAFTLVFVAVFISGLLILLFNYRFTFRSSIQSELTRWKVAAFTAAVTMPWTFLLPTKLFF